MEKFIECSARDQIAKVSICRPQVHNAFDDNLIRELTHTFVQLGEDPELRVILLASEGESFCAGADLNWMKRMVGYTLEENMEDAQRLARMFRVIRDCPKPVIARVHGAAYGGGVGLVACADIAVALASARFMLSEVKLGILPAVIMPFLIEKIGSGPLHRYALTAEPFTASEAKRIGLVTEVAETVEQLDQTILNLCETLKKNSPAALAACKGLLREMSPLEWDKLQSFTGKAIAEIRVSPEGQEGLRAFLEKRKPNW